METAESQDNVPERLPASPSPVLLMIYSVMATLLLLAVGVIEVGRNLWPEPPAEQFARAVEALESGEDRLALRLFEKLAKNGNPAAEYWLADINEFGLGTAKNIPAAVRLLTSSAAQGFVPAQVRLGEIYLSGIDVVPNYDSAIRLLTSAAKQRNAKALRLLGQAYAAGIGVAKNPGQAETYFAAAAANGDHLAVAELERIRTQLSDERRTPHRRPTAPK